MDMKIRTFNTFLYFLQEMELPEEVKKLKDAEVIIVEGKKDVVALGKLGFKAVEIDKPLFKFCEEIAAVHKEAIILTDLDKEGKRLYSRIKQNLERNGVKVDDRIRNYLFRETKLRQIEGINSYLSKSL